VSNGIRTVVISIVTAVWAINFTAPIFVQDYSPSPELNVAFMAIIGVLTASAKLEKDSKKSKTEESSSKQEEQKGDPDENIH
jgi:hypothetical protein